MSKVLLIKADRCTGCRQCEMVCSVVKEGVSNPARSRINIIKWEAEGIYIPLTCKQCENAPCMAICPVSALSRVKNPDYVTVDHEICIGCRSCVSVCPFGAINFDTISRKIIKCDQCEGDPQCVRFCEVRALEYIESDRINRKNKRDAALKISEAEIKAKFLSEKS